ncbi:hypothetical protein A343_2356 [Porphyromonas gingivalis JCVI SC001]|nr:hypothetical protein A343_2356 [Porphyromonas gingivalis JCVI SC001]
MAISQNHTDALPLWKEHLSLALVGLVAQYGKKNKQFAFHHHTESEA